MDNMFLILKLWPSQIGLHFIDTHCIIKLGQIWNFQPTGETDVAQRWLLRVMTLSLDLSEFKRNITVNSLM